MISFVNVSVPAAVILAALAVGCGGTSTSHRPSGNAGDAGSSGSGGLGGSSGACEPACGEGRECCAGHCVNPANDARNCGACGRACTGDTYCTAGACVTPPCTTTCSADAVCCGKACCGVGELCCDPQGPIDDGPRCLAPSDAGVCPVGCAPLCKCASPDTPIATPSGEKAIASLRIGDLVYSADHDAIRAVPILRIERTPAQHHQVVHVELANGEALEISPGHPTADGRTFGDLRVGERLDGTMIERVEIVPYRYSHTYDILPASDSGTYVAAGVLIGSTLSR